MTEIDPDTKAAIGHHLSDDLTLEKLYERLADSAGLGADEINKAAEGKAFFSRVWNRQKDVVCSHPLIQAYIRNPSVSDGTAIAAQVLNLLVGIPGLNMVVVASLAVRIGLRQLCADPPK
jgi:hypothetical protein